jgi:hypothetical protein
LSKPSPDKTSVNFRFHEDEYFDKVIDYIAGTYGAHYGHEVDGKNVQVVDLWEGMGSLLTTSRDTAIKYLVRFGRKGGYNEKDLLKAIHYTLLMLYAARNQERAEEAPSTEGPQPPEDEAVPKSQTISFRPVLDEDRGKFSPGYTG